MNTIGKGNQFYGYIIGIQLERCPDGGEPGNKMYALFEYNGKTSLFRIPDLELFNILSEHLCSMASSRHVAGEYGYNKLYIKHTKLGWNVSLP